MTNSNRQAFYNHILMPLFYGEDTTPAQIASEQYLPPLRWIVSNVSVDAPDFMQGPGRFTSPALFELVRGFFESDYAQIFNAVRASGKSYFLGSSIAIGKGDLRDVLGIGRRRRTGRSARGVRGSRPQRLHFGAISACSCVCRR